MATKQPRDYLNNANLLVEIAKSQEVHAGLSQEIAERINAENPEMSQEDRDSMIKVEANERAIECLSPRLVEMISLLVDNMATSWRWRNYTWIDDMRCDAHFNLCRVALKFNLEKAIASGNPPNPFAYYTQIAKRVFLTIIEKEKKLGRIRNDIIEMSDTKLLPSFARQHEEEKTQSGYELDGTKRVESNHYLRRRRKKAKVIKEDDIANMDDAEFKAWLKRKTAEYMAKQ